MKISTNITSSNQRGGITARNVGSTESNLDNRKYLVWKSRAEGLIGGIIISFIVNILSSYIFELLFG